jgi:hypothetical protein
MSVIVNEDVCELCLQPVKPGEELRRASDAGSMDDMGRIRYRWRHVACEAPPQPVAEGELPPWAGWLHDLASDPFRAAERLHALEQRVAALERRR